MDSSQHEEVIYLVAPIAFRELPDGPVQVRLVMRQVVVPEGAPSREKHAYCQEAYAEFVQSLTVSVEGTEGQFQVHRLYGGVVRKVPSEHGPEFDREPWRVEEVGQASNVPFTDIGGARME